MSLRRLLLSTAAVVALAFAAAPAADASIFCVGVHADCPDPKYQLSMQSAIDDAELTNDADVIYVGPGTYKGPYEYTGTGPLSIIGSGRDETTITADANPPYVLR